MPDKSRGATRSRPDKLLPLAPWIAWAWQGLFIPGHTVNQFMRFCLVGTSGLLVNWLVMTFCVHNLGLFYIFSSVLAFMVASVNNFIWNKKFTFKDQRAGAAIVGRQYLVFLAVALSGLGINLLVLAAAVEFLNAPPVPANVAGVLVATVSNFLGNKYLAFKKA